MKKTPIINDFRAGELTPDMDVRVDLKDYYRGCRILENAMPIIEGGVARVPGTYYVRPVKTDEGWNIRVTKSGTGTGVVTSDVAGINCGSSCYVFFVDEITVVLTATPDAGMSFTAWSGDGTGAVTRSLLMDGNKVVNAEFSVMPLGMVAYHMIVDDGILYMVGRRSGGVLAPYTLCISKYVIVGTGLSFIERKDYEGSTTEQEYYTLNIYGDFIYVSGMIVDGGAKKSFIRKINKNTLAVVWTYISHIDQGTGEWSYSMVSPKLYNGAVYWGNWILNTGGQIVKLNDSDGTEVWKVTTGYALSCFAVEIPDATNVDFIGGTTTAPEGRGISRRLQSTGAVVSTTGYGNNWLQGTISDANSYFAASRFSDSGVEKSALTKIKKSDLTLTWNASIDFRPSADEFEQFTNVVTDGSDFYCLGFAYVASIPGYRATLGKVDAAGTFGISLQHPTRNARAAIIVTADYIFVAPYNTFECRSKTDFSLIKSTGI